MVSEDILSWVERVGISGTAFYLVYLLLKQMQKKVFELSDKMITMAETTIKENTATLQEIRDEIRQHIKSKEPFIEEIKECKRERNEFLRRLEEKAG